MSGLPPLVLIVGPEELLVERAVASVVADRRETAPAAQVVRLQGSVCDAGTVALETSPSLFGEAKVVVLDRLDETSDEVLDAVVVLARDPAPETTLVITHRAGTRGKRALDAMRAGGARVIDCPAVKSDRDKNDFVVNEFRRAGRKVTPEAVRALIEAVGRDLRELAAACQQLVLDTTGVVDDRAVEQYHGGKVEATGFRVADAVVAGQTGEALRLLRHAIGAGVDPVPIVAVIAGQLRMLVRVGSAGRGSSAAVSKALGVAPWQVDKARRVLGHWHPEGLATAISAVALADADVKGGGRDPVYAVERAILAICTARTRER